MGFLRRCKHAGGQDVAIEPGIRNVVDAQTAGSTDITRAGLGKGLTLPGRRQWAPGGAENG